jgi:hypothetical protein
LFFENAFGFSPLLAFSSLVLALILQIRPLPVSSDIRSAIDSEMKGRGPPKTGPVLGTLNLGRNLTLDEVHVQGQVNSENDRCPWEKSLIL